MESPLTPTTGNDPELDPDREPEPPTKAIDKPAARTGKRNAPAEAPARAVGTTTRQPQSANANDNGTSSHDPADIENSVFNWVHRGVWVIYLTDLICSFP